MRWSCEYNLYQDYSDNILGTNFPTFHVYVDLLRNFLLCYMEVNETYHQHTGWSLQ